ncbi:MAG: hypothetical protein QOJ06_187 [Pseudonocardiales bacterium]|nr:hypothetical protein [Pseudonocardiales bacterium]
MGTDRHQVAGYREAQTAPCLINTRCAGRASDGVSQGTTAASMRTIVTSGDESLKSVPYATESLARLVKG